MRRLLCWLRGGHVPGGVVLFSYARVDRSVSQWPNRRGPTAIKILGVACARCGALQPAEIGPGLSQAVGEIVEEMVGKET